MKFSLLASALLLVTAPAFANTTQIHGVYAGSAGLLGGDCSFTIIETGIGTQFQLTSGSQEGPQIMDSVDPSDLAQGMSGPGLLVIDRVENDPGLEGWVGPSRVQNRFAVKFGKGGQPVAVDARISNSKKKLVCTNLKKVEGFKGEAAYYTGHNTVISSKTEYTSR